MTSTWKTEERGESTCSGCGAVYTRTVTRLPAKDQDSFCCSECGHEMDTWNSTYVPTYTLAKKRPIQQNDQRR